MHEWARRAMTDRRDVRMSFDLAPRIGELLLVSGAAATDAAATMEAVTRACGVWPTCPRT